MRPHAPPGAATGLVAHFRCGLWGGWPTRIPVAARAFKQTQKAQKQCTKAGEKTRDDDDNKKGRRGGEVRSALLREGGAEKRRVSAYSSTGPHTGRHGRRDAIAATPMARSSHQAKEGAYAQATRLMDDAPALFIRTSDDRDELGLTCEPTGRSNASIECLSAGIQRRGD